MLKIVELQHFKVSYNDFEKNKDYNIVITFTPQTKNENDVLGTGSSSILVPYSFGLVDTTVTDVDYNCSILVDDPGTGRPKPLFSFFTKKISSELKPITPNEPAKVEQFADEKVSKQFRGVRSPKGDSYINVDDNMIEIVSGDNKFIVSKQQISTHGKKTDYNIPTESKAGMFQESGIFRFLPSFFMIPVPHYIPDLSLILMLANKMDVLKKVIEEISTNS